MISLPSDNKIEGRESRVRNNCLVLNSKHGGHNSFNINNLVYNCHVHLITVTYSLLTGANDIITPEDLKDNLVHGINRKSTI